MSHPHIPTKRVLLRINIKGNGSTTPPPNRDYYFKKGTWIRILAKAKSGSYFHHWEGDMSGKVNPEWIKMSVNRIVTAVFVQIEYAVSYQVSPPGGGYAEINPPGPYHFGDNISITAYAQPGWKFVNWTGSVNSDSATLNLIVNGNINLVANFVQIPYSLQIKIIGEGTVTKNPDKPTYYYGEQVQLYGQPNPGWKFDHWDVDGVITTENPTTMTITGVSSSVAVVAPD